jgi:hypothetical protein
MSDHQIAGISLKDSGKRQEWNTGSRRDTREGKGRFDLLPWEVIEADARYMELGAKKYGDRNWEKGQPLSRYLDSGLRHLTKYMIGHRDEPHLQAARWNLAAYQWTLNRIRENTLPMELNDTGEVILPGLVPME